MGYKIGSFNCLNFGLGSNKDDQIFADIIADGQFDIIALQEIKSQRALERILKRLPKYWSGEADEKSAGTMGVFDYAFIWNTRRVQLVETQTVGGIRTYHPRIYNQYRIDRKNMQMELIRNPYFARFTPKDTAGGLSFEIRIINTHIRFRKSQMGKEESEENSPGAIAMRRNEFNVLTKAIYAKEADKRYGNNMPAYTILLGDYNLNLRSSNAGSPYLEEIVEIPTNGTMQKKSIVTKQDELTTLKRPSEAGEVEPEAGFSSNYDHFTYDAERFRFVYTSQGRIDTISKYCNGDFKHHRECVSDHVPIIMTINLK